MSALDNFLAQFKQISDVDHRQLFHLRHRAQHRRLQPRLLLALAASHRARAQGQELLRGPRAQHLPATAASRSSAGRDKKHVRLDEIDGRPAGAEKRCASSCRRSRSLDERGQSGRRARDPAQRHRRGGRPGEVPGDARDRGARARAPRDQIRSRTKELLETNQLLLQSQKELLAYKKGLTILN